MIQSFHTQLQVSLRALREVVAPALDSNNKQALEQFHLSLVTLEFLRVRLPYSRRYVRMELKHWIMLGQKVLALLTPAWPAQTAVTDAIALGQEKLADPEADDEEYLIISRQLRELISGMVTDAAGHPLESQLDALIVAATEHLLLCERVWCLPLGFELRPDELPGLEQLLTRVV